MKTFKLNYRYSLLGLIVASILWLPLGAVLAITGSDFTKRDTVYSMKYNGNRFWPSFFAVVFPPIAVILLLFKGVSIEESSH